jgi:hypothetical protein
MRDGRLKEVKGKMTKNRISSLTCTFVFTRPLWFLIELQTRKRRSGGSVGLWHRSPCQPPDNDRTLKSWPASDLGEQRHRTFRHHRRVYNKTRIWIWIIRVFEVRIVCNYEGRAASATLIYPGLAIAYQAEIRAVDGAEYAQPWRIGCLWVEEQPANSPAGAFG